MHSRRADCVLGEARLISSPSTMLAKMAPGLNSKSRCSWLKTLTPVTSVGKRSGVNWMRRNEQSMDRAIAFASIVLPTPGTSSMRRCPSATSATSASRISAFFPRTTRSTLCSISLNLAAKPCQSCGRSRTSTITSRAGSSSYGPGNGGLAPRCGRDVGMWGCDAGTGGGGSRVKSADRPEGHPARPLFAWFQASGPARRWDRLHRCDSFAPP